MSNRSITFLGTGTSQGIPVIGCTCEVCTSEDPRDKRLRTSVLITVGSRHLVVDVGPDFRQQILRAGIGDLEAILLTHEHNDHIIGMDDIRPIYFRRGTPVPVYGLTRVLDSVKHRFDYFFSERPYPGVPRIAPVVLDHVGSFSLLGMDIVPVRVWHGQLSILGFRFDDLVYITDAKTIDKTELEKIRGCRILVINALHHKEHHSHLNLQEALAMVERVQPREAFFVHMSHWMGRHREVAASLPAHITLAYDGLRLTF